MNQNLIFAICEGGMATLLLIVLVIKGVKARKFLVIPLTLLGYILTLYGTAYWIHVIRNPDEIASYVQFVAIIIGYIFMFGAVGCVQWKRV